VARRLMSFTLLNFLVRIHEMFIIKADRQMLRESVLSLDLALVRRRELITFV
jgi:hypothetical protein